jgi:hypothetical protein
MVLIKRRDDLLVGTKERAIAAIEAGDKAAAKKYLEELYAEGQPLHDRYVEWIQFLLGFIAERLGEETVEEALRGIVTEIYKDRWISLFKQMSAEEIAGMWCRINKSHYSDIIAEEDEEKFIITIPYCASGGKIQQIGKAAGRRTKKAYPWSFNEAGVSFYCCHESVFNKMFKELGFKNMHFEYHNQFEDDGTPTGRPCRFYIYKNKTAPDTP